jgi:hypothetical protein
LSDLPTGNIGITQIQLRVTFGPAGASSAKYLTFYKGASNTISGSIGSMRGASIGALSVSNAYDRTVTNTGRLKWAYMDTILRSWHEKKLHTPAEIDAAEPRRQGGAEPRRTAPDKAVNTEALDTLINSI